MMGAVPEKFDTITYHRSKKNRKKLDVMTAFPVKEVHHECHKQKNTALIASMNWEKSAQIQFAKNCSLFQHKLNT